MKSAVRIGMKSIAVFALLLGIACTDNRSANRPSAGEKDAAGTAGTVAQAAKDTAEKTGEALTDAWVTAYVNTRFVGEDLLKGSDINVDTADHVVTLTGMVPSAAGRARAVELAKGTDGVNSVVDHLRIGKPSKPLPPKD